MPGMRLLQRQAGCQEGRISLFNETEKVEIGPVLKSVLCLFDFFDGSFSVIQPKALLPIFILAARPLNCLTKKSLVKTVVSGLFPL